MLKVRIASGLNFAWYRSGAEEVYGIDLSIELLAKDSNRLNTAQVSEIAA
jgi:hypothetical protein